MKWMERWLKADTISAPEAARVIEAAAGNPPPSPAVVEAPASSPVPSSPARSVSLVLCDLLDYVRDANTPAEAKDRRKFYLDAARLVLHEPPPDVEPGRATQESHRDAPRHAAQAPAWRARAASALRDDGLEDREPREGHVSADESPEERDEREWQQSQREAWEQARLAAMNGAQQHPEDEAG